MLLYFGLPVLLPLQFPFFPKFIKCHRNAYSMLSSRKRRCVFQLMSSMLVLKYFLYFETWPIYSHSVFESSLEMANTFFCHQKYTFAKPVPIVSNSLNKGTLRFSIEELYMSAGSSSPPFLFHFILITLNLW